MKRLIYGFILLLSIFIFTNVNADYKEGNFSTPSCSSYAKELKKSYDDYSFNKKTGKFSVKGRIYEESIKSPSSLAFFRVSKDQKTLYIYVTSYNNNISMVESYNLPKHNCEDTYKAVKKAVKIKTNENSASKNKNENKSENNNVNNNAKEEKEQEKSKKNKSNNEDKKNKSDDNSQTTTKKNNDKENNKNTSSNDELDKNLITIAFIGGFVLIFSVTVIILRKKNIIS
ncbi:MAG: hypothetical protein Q4C29_02470 [bacterium]|nr:hypothetical protein [bacterium]